MRSMLIFFAYVKKKRRKERTQKVRFFSLDKKDLLSKTLPSYPSNPFSNLLSLFWFLLLLPPIERIKKLSTPRAPSLDKR